MTNIGVIKRLLGYVSRYRMKLIALILVAMVGVSFEVVKPLPIKIVIDNVLSGHPLPTFLQDITGLTMPDGKKRAIAFLHYSNRFCYDRRLPYFSGRKQHDSWACPKIGI